jgi:hypothetical protein
LNDKNRPEGTELFPPKNAKPDRASKRESIATMKKAGLLTCNIAAVLPSRWGQWIYFGSNLMRYLQLRDSS